MEPATKPESDIVTKPLTKPESDVVTKPLTKPERDVVTKPERDVVTKPERDVVTNPERDVVTKPERDAVTKSERDAVTKPESDVVTKPLIKPERDVVTKPDSDVVTKPERDAVTKPERDVVTKPERDVVTKSERDAVTKPERDVVTKPLTKPERDVVTKPERDAVTKPERDGGSSGEELERGSTGGQKNIACHVNTALLPLKVFNFFYFGAVGAVIPFISVYLQHLQLTAPEAGVVAGVSVLLAMMVRPTLGVLADTCPARSLLLPLCCLMWGLGFSSLWFVPRRHELVETVAWFQCQPTSPENCLTSNPDWVTSGVQCSLNSRSALNTSLSPAVFTLLNNQTTRLGHRDHLSPLLHLVHRSTASLPSKSIHQDQSPNSEQSGFFANLEQSGIFANLNLTCWVSGRDRDTRDSMSYTAHVKHGENRITQPPATREVNGAFTGQATSSVIRDSNHTFPPTRTSFAQSSLPSTTSVDRQPHTQRFSERQCNYSCVRFHATPPPATSVYTPDLAFCLSLTLICLSRAFYSSSNSLLDSVTYSLLGSDRHMWGRQRLWGTLGTASVALLFTLLNDHVGGGGFSMQFATCACLSVLAITTTTFFHRASGDAPSRSSTPFQPHRCTHLRVLLQKTAVKIFLVKLLVMGVFSGSAQNFIFWFLRELGSGQSVLGACLLANCLSTVVILRFSPLIIRRLGETRTMYLALPAYCIRFVAISVFEEPWVAVPLELLHGVTYSLLWAAASASTHLLSSPSTLNTCQAIAGAVYWDLGRGLGSMLTGQLFRAVGARWTFRAYGVLAAILLPVSWFLDKQWPLPAQRMNKTDNEEEDIEVKDIEELPLPAYTDSSEGERTRETRASREKSLH